MARRSVAPPVSCARLRVFHAALLLWLAANASEPTSGLVPPLRNRSVLQWRAARADLLPCLVMPAAATAPEGALRRARSGRTPGSMQEASSERAAVVGLETAPPPCLGFEEIKNIRDVCTVRGSGIKPGRVFRTGYLSLASAADVVRIHDQYGIKTLALVLMLAGAMMVSTRCFRRARGIFIGKINDGGLVLLNELLLQYSGEGINQVMRLLARKEMHPVALYCTAGKDRTGLVMALTLSALGVQDDAILDDYCLSDNAYRELDDKSAMVGALEQHDLDPDRFLCAPRYVMEQTLRNVRDRYGSVDSYLDSIGFGYKWRQQLRRALLDE